MLRLKWQNSIWHVIHNFKAPFTLPLLIEILNFIEILVIVILLSGDFDLCTAAPQFSLPPITLVFFQEQHDELLILKIEMVSETVTQAVYGQSSKESVKLRALRAHVPTCLACLHAYVATCLACLRAHMPTCLACLRAHVPKCLACLRAKVLSCKRASSSLSHLPAFHA